LTAGAGSQANALAGLPEARARSRAQYLQLSWTAEGFEQEVRFLDDEGKPMPDDGHIYGVRKEHDEQGLLVRLTYLDSNGQPALHTRNKIAIREMRRSSRGEVV